MVIEGITALLQNEPTMQIMGSAATADAAYKFLKLQHVDITLLDINLPDQSGLEVCRHINQKHPATKVIAISNHALPSYIQKITEYGGNGYLLKNTTRQELLQAIEMVMLGKEYFSHEIIRSLREQKHTGDLMTVTRREKEILELLSEGLTTGKIAEQLFISTSTVDTHRKNLLEKLGVSNTPALIKKATRLNLID